MRRLGFWILLVVLAPACGGSSPTAPTGAALTVSITPTPLAVPAVGAPLVWNVTLHETGGLVGLRLDRDEATVVDAAGVSAVQRQGFWGPVGCTSCSGQLRIEAGRIAMFGTSAVFLGAPRPGTFRYTVFYTDDMGNAGSSTVSVPVN